MAQKAFVVKANEDVIGKNVKNQANEDLGKVKELVLDKFTGQTSYVVLESGAILGMGGKLFAIPWKAFTYDKDKEAFILNIDKEKLKKAPGFEKDHWPEMNGTSFITSVNSFWE